MTAGKRKTKAQPAVTEPAADLVSTANANQLPVVSEAEQLEADIQPFLMQDQAGAQAVLARVCPRTETRVRVTVALFLSGLCRGLTHRAALEKAGIPWAMYSSVLRGNKALSAIYEHVSAIHTVIIKQSRENALQLRAVDGYEDPVYVKGVKVGTIRRYSDKLLELALKASDPKTYGDKDKAQQAATVNVGIQFISEGVHHTPQATVTVSPAGQDKPKGENIE